jgi:hypothetical protein
VSLAVPGRHLALNSGAALLTGVGLGLPEALLVEGLGGFTGVRRRMELKGSVAGIRVYDDYAHHPTELIAQLAAAREVVGQGRLVVAFQPHRYSRTLAFAQEFGRRSGGATRWSSWRSTPPARSRSRARRARPSRRPCRTSGCCSSPLDRRPALLADAAEPGDLVLTLGAGDVTAIGPGGPATAGRRRAMSVQAHDLRPVDLKPMNLTTRNLASHDRPDPFPTCRARSAADEARAQAERSARRGGSCTGCATRSPFSCRSSPSRGCCSPPPGSGSTGSR